MAYEDNTVEASEDNKVEANGPAYEAYLLAVAAVRKTQWYIDLFGWG